MVVQGTVDSPITTVCGWPNVQAMTLPETHNPRRTRLAVVGFAALTLLFLAGCSNAVEPGTSVFSREAITAEATPMFASDEDAAAAAERDYSHFLEIGDQIARDGGANSERLKTLVSPELLVAEVSALDFYKSGNLHAIGFTRSDSWSLQWAHIGNLETSLEAYVCLRLDGLRIIDSVDSDVTPLSRSPKLPMVVELYKEKEADRFIVLSTNVWTGSNFC
jgi:hypothetical protein